MTIKLSPVLIAVLMAANAIGSDLAATGLKADNAINKAAISVSVNGSTVLDQPVGIRRISIANAEIAEAVAVSTNEIVVNGKMVGDTSLIVWDLKGSRSMLDVHVVANTSKIDAVRAELLKEAGPDVTIDVQDGTVFLNGTVADETLGATSTEYRGHYGQGRQSLASQYTSGTTANSIESSFRRY